MHWRAELDPDYDETQGVVPNPRDHVKYTLKHTKPLNILAQTINEALKVGPLSKQPSNIISD